MCLALVCNVGPDFPCLVLLWEVDITVSRRLTFQVPVFKLTLSHSPSEPPAIPPQMLVPRFVLKGLCMHCLQVRCSSALASTWGCACGPCKQNPHVGRFLLNSLRTTFGRWGVRSCVCCMFVKALCTEKITFTTWLPQPPQCCEFLECTPSPVCTA